MDLQVPATGFCWSISVSTWGSSTSTRGGFSWASCSAFGGFSSGAGTALGGFSSAHGKRKQTWYLKMSYFAEFIKLTWLDYSVRGRKQGEGLPMTGACCLFSSTAGVIGDDEGCACPGDALRTAADVSSIPISFRRKSWGSGNNKLFKFEWWFNEPAMYFCITCVAELLILKNFF